MRFLKTLTLARLFAGFGRRGTFLLLNFWQLRWLALSGDAVVTVLLLTSWCDPSKNSWRIRRYSSQKLVPTLKSKNLKTPNPNCKMIIQNPRDTFIWDEPSYYWKISKRVILVGYTLFRSFALYSWPSPGNPFLVFGNWRQIDSTYLLLFWSEVVPPWIIRSFSSWFLIPAEFRVTEVGC